MLKHTLLWSGLVMLTACGDKDTDPTTTDLDGDGFVAADDCDDSDASAFPGNAEVCDGIDNDCDGNVDDSPTDGETFYVDADGDGAGSATEIVACEVGDGVSASSDDCDDIDASAFPGAEEVCDSRDNNCDGTVDEGLQETYYLDLDQDGYGDPKSTKDACQAPSGYVSNDLDCDDRSADVSPDNPWYPDMDGDGFGSDADVVASCEQPLGHIEDGGDCDDTDAQTHPGAAADVDSTLCSTDSDGDGFGDSAPVSGATAGTDCDDDDALTFPGSVAEDKALCMIDSDGDGFGDSSPPKGVDAGTDCDDDDARTFPGAVAEDKSLCLRDSDGDGFGDSSPPKGIDAGTDCDDSRRQINPDAEEVCDGIDNNCDSVTDDDAIDRETLYADGDGDGFGDSGVTTIACRGASGYTRNSTDCDDTDAEINPDGFEDCSDGIDNDCDGAVDDVCAYGADDADLEITGSSSSYAGTSIAAGDVDGDGVTDLLVGSQLYASSGSSRTYGKGFLFLGPLSGGRTAVGDADVDVVGSGSGSDYASATSDISGDFDGDGYDDMVIGAPYANTYRGAVYVHQGPVTSGDSLTASDADATIVGSGTYTYLANYLARAGDVDSDGDAELITGDIGGTPFYGSVYVFDDPSGSLSTTDAVATVTGSAAAAYAGYSADMLPDTDGDGYDELIYGEYGAGRAYMLAGPISGSLSGSSDAVASFTASSATAAGRAVAGGDLDGDGYGDVVVTAPYLFSNRGSVQVFYGPVSGSMTLSSDQDANIVGADADSFLGEGLKPLSVGDVNDDGTDDLLIGQTGYDSGTGASFLFYGNMSGALSVTDADIAVYGTSTGGGLGQSTLIGDVDDDGSSDLILAAPYVGRTSSGAVYVFFGSGF